MVKTVEVSIEKRSEITLTKTIAHRPPRMHETMNLEHEENSLSLSSLTLTFVYPIEMKFSPIRDTQEDEQREERSRPEIRVERQSSTGP